MGRRRPIPDPVVLERQEQIEGLRNELTEQHDQLSRRREELTAWATQRQTDIEEQAARLVSREQELDQQHAHHERLAHEWEEERLGLQQEVRELRSTIRAGEPSLS